MSAGRFSTVCVVGNGRVGSAVAARLAERDIEVHCTGRELACGGEDLVLLCVTDAAIAEVAKRIEPGPWIAHMSGAARLDVLAPHTRRFSVHPLQTFVLTRGAEQFDGAFGAVTAETEEGRATATALAELLGLTPFPLLDQDRPLYHAACGFAAQFVVALWRAATVLTAECDIPVEVLLPLMYRTIENDFELTGPIARGDWGTLDRHLEAIRARQPSVEPLYVALVASFGGEAAHWARRSRDQ